MAFIMWSIMINQNLIRIYIYESSFYRGDENMFVSMNPAIVWLIPSSVHEYFLAWFW